MRCGFNERFLSANAERATIAQEGHTPFALAARHGNVAALQLLAKEGADIERQNNVRLYLFDAGCLAKSHTLYAAWVLNG